MACSHLMRLFVSTLRRFGTIQYTRWRISSIVVPNSTSHMSGNRDCSEEQRNGKLKVLFRGQSEPLLKMAESTTESNESIIVTIINHMAIVVLNAIEEP